MNSHEPFEGRSLEAQAEVMSDDNRRKPIRRKGWRSCWVCT